MRFPLRSFVLCALAAASSAQQPATTLTVDGIFGRGEFDGASGHSIHWLADGNAWITMKGDPAGGNSLIRVDALTGAETVLADGSVFLDSAGKRFTAEAFALSADEKKALIFHHSARVWRLNTKGYFSVLDLATRKLTPISTKPGFEMFATLSPDGSQVAFVRDNNLFVTTLATGQERALTQDGSDVIVNGTSDWVYEEELNLRDAFRWSPDSKRIAFWHFDQSPEPLHPIMDQAAVHAKATMIRYPQPGDPNAKVKIGVVELASDRVTWMNLETDSAYVPTVQWMDADSLVVQLLNRRQNRLDLLMTSATSGQSRTVLVETDKSWIDMDDGAPYWFAGGKMFLWSSQRSGWRRYYLYNRDGSPVRALTPDSSDAERVADITKNGTIFITEATPGPLQRQVFSYDLRRKPERVRVTTERGWHTVDESPNGRILIDTWSAAGDPPQSVLRDASSLAVKRTLYDNKALRTALAATGVKHEFVTIPMPDGTKLNAFRLTGAGFDSTKPHPVIMYVYGGPNSQTVMDNWGGRRDLWHRMLAQKGYVVMSVDNRGTGARGSAFEKVTYMKTGYLESQDQIDAAKWIASRPWADPSRIAMWGWSGGGFMTALTTSRGGKVFHSGIVVAPVIDWRLYDDIYTERYMRTPDVNADGYKMTSVLTYANGLTARLLLVHGTADDNVHPQNTFWFANALQSYNTQFEMMLYPGRTHSISGGNTQVHLFTMMTDYFDRTLGMSAASSSAMGSK